MQSSHLWDYSQDTRILCASQIFCKRDLSPTRLKVTSRTWHAEDICPFFVVIRRPHLPVVFDVDSHHIQVIQRRTEGRKSVSAISANSRSLDVNRWYGLFIDTFKDIFKLWYSLL